MPRDESLPRSLVDEIWERSGMNRPQAEREKENRERALEELPPEIQAQVKEIQELRALVAEGPGEMEPEPPALLGSLQDPFIESLAGREELRQALAVSGDSRAQRFLEDMSSPRWAKWSFSALARKNKLTPKVIVEIFREYKLTQGMVEIVRGVPEVGKKLSRDAQGRWTMCPSCGGVGEIRGKRLDLEDPKSEREWIECKECTGSGFVDRPDPDAREQVLEIVGWTGKSRGTQVQVNVGRGQSLESMLDEIEEVERRGQGLGPVVDVE